MKPLLSMLLIAGAAFFAQPLLANEPIEYDIEKRQLAGVANYSRLGVSDGFAGAPVGFGGATEPSAMSGLHGQGYASVIDLRLAQEEGVDILASQRAAVAAGINYLPMPLDVKNLSPAAIEAVLLAMGDSANQPIYMNCNSATRVAMVWMIGRVTRDGWSVEAATREVQQITQSPDIAIGAAKAYLDSD